MPRAARSARPFSRFGRGCLLAALILAGTASVPGQVPSVPPPDPAAEALLQRARAALGGGSRIDAVATLTLEGDIADCFSRACDYGHFAIAMERPSAFAITTHRPARADASRTFAADGTPLYPMDGPETLGLDGDRVISRQPMRIERGPIHYSSQEPASPSPRVIAADRLRAREEFVRVSIGLFGAVPPGIPVRLAAVEGDPHALSLTLEGRTSPIRVVFDATTGLPAALGDFTFEDYRSVGGLMVPHAIVRTTHTGFSRRHLVRRVRVDEPIPPKVFGR